MPLIVTTTDADEYFETRRDSAQWTLLATGENVTELTTAQNQLELVYNLDPTEQTHLNSIYEQALFNIKYGSGIEDRMSQIASQVAEAGLIREKFRPDAVATVVICPYAMRALRNSMVGPTQSFFGVVPIYRDENA